MDGAVTWAPRERMTAGYTLEEVKRAAYVEGLKEAGFQLEDVMEAGYVLSEILRGGYTKADAVDAGYAVAQPQVALEAARVAGYACKDARAAGFTCKDAREAGMLSTCKDAREAGFKAGKECYEAGFTYVEGRAAGFPTHFNFNGTSYDYSPQHDFVSWWSLCKSPSKIRTLIAPCHLAPLRLAAAPCRRACGPPISSPSVRR